MASEFAKMWIFFTTQRIIIFARVCNFWPGEWISKFYDPANLWWVANYRPQEVLPYKFTSIRNILQPCVTLLICYSVTVQLCEFASLHIFEFINLQPLYYDLATLEIHNQKKYQLFEIYLATLSYEFIRISVIRISSELFPVSMSDPANLWTNAIINLRPVFF